MTLRLLAAAAFALTLVSCSAPRKAVKAVKNVFRAVEAAEKIAEGRPEEAVPIVIKILNDSQDYGTITQDGNAILVEVKEIPGLGIDMPRSENKAYFLRVDLSDTGSGTKVALSFFKARRSDPSHRDDGDSFLEKGAVRLFAVIFESLMKSGMSFK